MKKIWNNPTSRNNLLTYGVVTVAFIIMQTMSGLGMLGSAMKGYLVDALDYVLKPVSYYAFSQRIDRAITRMHKRKKVFISVQVL